MQCMLKEFQKITLPKFNIAPEKWWLEDYFPIGKVTFQGRIVKLREGSVPEPLVALKLIPWQNIERLQNKFHLQFFSFKDAERFDSWPFNVLNPFLGCMQQQQEKRANL